MTCGCRTSEGKNVLGMHSRISQPVPSASIAVDDNPIMAKKAYPLSRVYGLLEPGPVVLLTTAHAGQVDVMAMSWHTMLEFEPPLVGCVVSNRNYSYELLKASRECVINIPTVDIAEKVARCGNSTGSRTDKFTKFGLARSPADVVAAPLIDECFASLECRVVDTGMVTRYCFFVVEVLKAWVDPGWKHPRTLHHRGHGNFMVAGDAIRLRSKMK
jgi:flavin reductase (DIM6/NTAB) family NADH-FMN oxidoreductase RutF